MSRSRVCAFFVCMTLRLPADSTYSLEQGSTILFCLKLTADLMATL